MLQKGQVYSGRIGVLKSCISRYVASQYLIHPVNGYGGLGETLLDPTTLRIVIYFGLNSTILGQIYLQRIGRDGVNIH